LNKDYLKAKKKNASSTLKAVNMKTRPQRQHKTRGFTLVELGIVVGVISLLASSVLAGRGFIRAAEHTKITSEIDKIYKAVDNYAGRRGGTLQESLDILPALIERQLIGDLPSITKVRVKKREIDGEDVPFFRIDFINDGTLDQNAKDDLFLYFARYPNHLTVEAMPRACKNVEGKFAACFAAAWEIE
jgi:hypothetical protein